MNISSIRNWSPPDDWTRVVTIDAHTAGEPLRVIIHGFPRLEGDSILERRREAGNQFDQFRTMLMWEPRGHADMYGCLLTTPVSKEADFGVLFLHNEGYSTMCGHGIIAVATVAVETGLVSSAGPETRIRIDTPAGLVTAYARVSSGRVSGVRFHNVPSFVFATDRTVDVPSIGEVRYDVAFGGAFYAFVSSDRFGVELEPQNVTTLIEIGKKIKASVMNDLTVSHPEEKDLGFLYGTIFVGPPGNQSSHSRNVCIFAEGEVDRSPTGTGVSARLALHYSRGEIGIGEPITIESILGTMFTGKVVKEAIVGEKRAVIPEVEGVASITGRHEFFIDPHDTLKNGFLLR